MIMRLTLWRQFSSNHSNSFIVVGKFETVDAAHSAYLHVRRAMRRIIEAHQRSQPELVEIPNDDDYPMLYRPSPVELEVFAPYGIVPDRMADWTTYNGVDETLLYEAVRRFENYLFVADPRVGYAGAEPWDRLVSTLGGQIQKLEEAEYGYFAVDLQCTAPDAETAARIHQQLTADFDDQPIPWLLNAYDNVAEVQALEVKYLIWRRWDKEQRRLNHHLETMPRRDREAFRTVVADHQSQQPFEMDDDTRMKILDTRTAVDFIDYFATITLDSRQIDCRNLVFRGYSVLGLALPALVTWMRDQGCEVNFTFRRTNFRREKTLVYRAGDELAAGRILEKLRMLQTDQPTLPKERGSTTLLTSRDQLSLSYNEFTIILYDLYDGSSQPLHNFFRANKCRRVSANSKWIEIPLDEG
jgi:hypothetical protein